MKLKAYYKLKSIMGDDAKEALAANELYLFTAGEVRFDYQRFLNFCYQKGLKQGESITDFCRKKYGDECPSLINELFGLTF